MKIGLGIILSLPLDFHSGTVSVGRTSSSSTLTCRIRGDDGLNLNFSSLRVFVQYRIDGNGPWISTPTTSPDQNGDFSVSVPKSTTVSLTIDTTDPTIRHAWAESGDDFYSLSHDLPQETVARSELFIASTSPDSIEQVIE